MLASVLNSDRAIHINIQIVRIFIKMREMIASHKEILQRLEVLESKMTENDKQILEIFKYLKQLALKQQHGIDQNNRKRIGYRRKNE